MVNPAIQDKRAYFEVRPGPGWSWAICETKAEAQQYVSEDGDEKYELREVWMTPNEFKKLREHDGW